MACPEALLSALALLSRTAPALLAFAKERAEGHGHPRAGMARGPCDTHRRAILAPVSPPWRRPWGTRLVPPLQRGTALEAMPVLEGEDV
jgi:hypothetical protein